MAYHFDPYDNSLVIDGFEKGIADNPYEGIADMRNINIISIPKEGSVNFATSKISQPSQTASVVSADAGADTITLDSNSIETGAGVTFSGGSLPAGIVAGTIYWLLIQSGSTYKVYTNYNATSVLNITSDGTGSVATVAMSQPKYFTYASQEATPAYFMVDAAGRVWSNTRVTGTSSYWTYTGNKINNQSNGNGIVYYSASNGTGYVFVFSNSSIDYSPTLSTSVAWTYQWNPSTGTAAGYNANPTSILKSGSATNSHEAKLMPTNQVIFCDANWVDRFYETNPATAFDPTSTATYTYDQTSLLPANDTAQCLEYLGTNILVGGKKNVIYPWNGTATTFNYPILIAENDISKMVTVNTNTYVFAGNRGRIYRTNGTNANLYKKLPDHISGTIEPYYTWGGATFNKNQLYFSAKVTTNGGSAINQYGGLWAIDLDTDAMRLVNKLSYATYAGYATAIIANFATNAAGTGLFIGWDDNSSGYGIDTTVGTPYTGGQATIDSDLIPIGTFEKPRDLTKIEYRLTRPLVSGESIAIKTRTVFNTTDTGYTTALTDSTVGNFSGISDINFKNAQWCQLQIVLTSTASSPSYVRLKEIRIKGLKSPMA